MDEADASPGADDLPPLFDAMREQSSRKVVDSGPPLEVIGIDHFERTTKE
jgi:hypothetical protein